ncbi:hypothetical protein G3O07_23970 [Pseudomonas laurentiana]|uniref:RHS repeat-associated core domain-containing protein n=1 Tax=Pseudomonas laurentiana TaxID=2364649 RepID=A0A6I5RWR8_9PSED|nr:hypothetical protein [Pseudomonas laurentiana]
MGRNPGPVLGLAQHKGIQNPLRFQGQYYDHETGLHYNRYRYNDPLIGRLGEKRILLI